MPEDYKATKSGKVNVKLPEVVGKGYGTFWRWKGRYSIMVHHQYDEVP